MRASTRPRASVLLIVIAGLLALSSSATAHPGGLDASGCHTNRKTGNYHCHRSTSAPTTVLPVPDASESGIVKKSRSGICHAPGTTYHAQTQHFTAFESLEACLASGGRLPKG